MDERIASRRFDDISDEALFALVRADGVGGSGDPAARAALEELFDRYHARVHTWCARMLGDDALADDATQEIFMRMLLRPVPYREHDSFGAWLYVVTRNHCLNARRRRNREVEGDATAWLERALDTGRDPAAAAVSGDRDEIIRRVCTEVLTALEQEVVYLRYHWGLRVREIGDRLGLENVSGARTHLATATRKVREALVARLGEAAVREWFEGE
jgi:RNA polymerase sigma-70 factor (ECF subfamily)